jgi:hypothetical protein
MNAITRKSGLYGTTVGVVSRKAGTFSIEAGLAGYNVYVGIDALPDLVGAPTYFSATLPIMIPTTPPGLGTKTYNVVVRKVNAAGLESQNQRAFKFTIGTSSQLILPVIDPPVGVQAFVQKEGAIRIVGIYPGAGGTNSANEWRMWYDTTPPVVSDPYDMNQTVIGRNMTPIVTGGNAAGTYYIALALYRSADGYLSPETRVTVTVPVSLDAPLPY